MESTSPQTTDLIKPLSLIHQGYRLGKPYPRQSRREPGRAPYLSMQRGEAGPRRGRPARPVYVSLGGEGGKGGSIYNRRATL